MTLRWLTIPMAYVVLAGTPVIAHALKSGTEVVATSRPVLDSVRPGAALYDQVADTTSARTWIDAFADSMARVVTSLDARLDGAPRQPPDTVQVGALR